MSRPKINQPLNCNVLCQKLMRILARSITRNCVSTRSQSARRRGGDTFESRSNTPSKLKTLKMVPTALLLCQLNDINS